MAGDSAEIIDGLSSTSRWKHVDMILNRPGPSTPSDYSKNEIKEWLRTECRVLVIGAGGLGCEILQNLALLGFHDIHVIDMDTIDVSNLNRQFLFRQNDVGQPKAQVAADFVMKRVPGCKVTPYFGKIQDKDDDYYLGFGLIVCGLDSVAARRWINATMVNIARQYDEIKPLIDGGTEGFKGQSRVILPTITSCYECSLDMLTPQTSFPICTIANTPRLPEHCIEWASVLEWPRVFKDKRIDGDDPDHIDWLYGTASARAKEYHINGVTWSLTQGVVKNIIPAVASTNAIIAASCCNEALKIATTCAPYLQNYMMYNGNESVYTYTFEHQKRVDCPVCGQERMSLEASSMWTLQDLINHLMERPDLQLKAPSLRTASRSLFLQAPPQLRKATEANLDQFLQALLESDDNENLVIVTDTALPISLELNVTLRKP